MDFVTFREIADRIGVGIDTIRRTVRGLDLTVQKEKTSTSKGVRVHCLNIDDANQIITYFENRNKPDANSDTSVMDRFGYFYIIQLVPEAIPKRVKLGYTDNLDTRLREHQTSAPTAKYLGHWKCKRSWDQAATDSITRENCQLVMNEVYEGDIEGFLNRAEEFFRIMPQNLIKPQLSEYSPLKTKRKRH